MAVSATEYKYVQLDERNIPIIAGTTMKVVELVEAQSAYGWSPEEIHFQHRYLIPISVLRSNLQMREVGHGA